MRTTVDLDPTVLEALKQRSRAERKSLGRLVSELLAPALTAARPVRQACLTWHTAPMSAKVDLDDKDAVAKVIDAR